MDQLEVESVKLVVILILINVLLKVRILLPLQPLPIPSACTRTEDNGEKGCIASDTYVFKACKDMRRKGVKIENGILPHGTSCGNVMCSKQFFGFSWKTKTTKIVCECKDGSCGWSKPLHKCPIGNITIIYTY